MKESIKERLSPLSQIKRMTVRARTTERERERERGWECVSGERTETETGRETERETQRRFRQGH